MKYLVCKKKHKRYALFCSNECRYSEEGKK